MIVWLAAVVAVACDVDAALATLADEGEEAAYRCVIDDPAAERPLLAAIDALPDGDLRARPRYTRALALRLAAEDGAWDPALVVRLNPADRRLLGDAVKARRGRRSPSPDHDAVFAKQPWYHPSPGYTDARLSAVDQANLALAADPTAFDVTPDPPAPARCGCATTPGGSAWALLGLLAYFARSRIANCTRRFAARPSSLPLSPTGRVAP